MSVDVLELNRFLDNSVNPFKWINDIKVIVDGKVYDIRDLRILKRDKDECLVMVV